MTAAMSQTHQNPVTLPTGPLLDLSYGTCSTCQQPSRAKRCYLPGAKRLSEKYWLVRTCTQTSEMAI